MHPPAILAAVLLGTSALAAVTTVPAGAEQSVRTAHSAHRAAGANEWTTYHGDNERSGRNARMPAYHRGLHVIRRITLDGQVYASPIVARGLTIVATENNTVYAFGPRNHVVWKRHLGAPSPASQRPCGNIDPLGITGTPVYSERNHRVYVAAEFGAARPFHRLYALKIGTGAVVFKRTLDFKGVDRTAMQERGALTITDRRVWVPFGGLAGDCGNYKGRVVGWKLDGSSTVRYTVPTAREAGIWTPPGASVGPSGNLFVSVGNGASGPGDKYDFSDSILRIGTGGRLLDHFSPTTWATDNQSDLDLGSQGPAIVQNKWVFSAGKSGTAYVLRLRHLGGIGGQVSKTSLCTSFGGTAVRDNVVYVPCTDGVRAVRIDNSGHMHMLWQAPSSITGSPVVGGGVVWTLDTGSGVLHGLGPFHGGARASVAVGSVTRFATPALSGRRILIGTMSGLTVLGY
ncbi:MAG TPA: PQQ-binding-like beta-propeller repeat protein [Jatrophihabitans sp.]